MEQNIRFLSYTKMGTLSERSIRFIQTHITYDQRVIRSKILRETNMKLQEISREDVEDPNIDEERKRKGGVSGPTIKTTDDNRDISTGRKFRGRCHLCLKHGQMVD